VAEAKGATSHRFRLSMPPQTAIAALMPSSVENLSCDNRKRRRMNRTSGLGKFWRRLSLAFAFQGLSLSEDARCLLEIRSRGRAVGSWVACYAGRSRNASAARTDAQGRNALNECLPFPSPLAFFEDSYLIANMNRAGNKRRSANGENRLTLVNHHVRKLWYL